MFFVFQGEPARGVRVKELDQLKGVLLQLDKIVVENRRQR